MVKNKLKRNRLLLFFYRVEGQLKGRTIGGSAVFTLHFVMSITKLYTHDITFSRYGNSN